MSPFRVLYPLRTEQRKIDPQGRPYIMGRVEFLPFCTSHGKPLTIFAYTPEHAFSQAKEKFPNLHIAVEPAYAHQS